MARVLIVGCGCRGQELARELGAAGHAVRGTTRDAADVEAIEAAGAEGVVADPDRLGTLLPLMAGVTVICWLMGTAEGDDVAALHGDRLESLLAKLVDSGVRGLVYEAAGSVDAGLLDDGAARVQAAGSREQHAGRDDRHRAVRARRLARPRPGPRSTKCWPASGAGSGPAGRLLGERVRQPPDQAGQLLGPARQVQLAAGAVGLGHPRQRLQLGLAAQLLRVRPARLQQGVEHARGRYARLGHRVDQLARHAVARGDEAVLRQQLGAVAPAAARRSPRWPPGARCTAPAPPVRRSRPRWSGRP